LKTAGSAGVFVNGIGIDHSELREGDVIGFGLDDSYLITFHLSGAQR
jgi:hypothetical protein